MSSQTASAAVDATPVFKLRATLQRQLIFSGLVAIVLLIFSAGSLIIASKSEMDMAPTGHLIGIIGALASSLVINCAPKESFDDGSLSFPILGPLMHLIAFCLLIPFLSSDYHFINLFYYSTLSNCNVAIIVAGAIAALATSAVGKRKLFSVKDSLLAALWATLYLVLSYLLYSRLPRF